MTRSKSLPQGCHRAQTIASHRRSVERVVLAMCDNLEHPLCLQDMAEIAYLSPYHFNRVFREVTGIPPTQFLYALRIKKAKQLLVTTDLRITDICSEVGYNSLGTFATSFVKLVGVSPIRFRRFVNQFDGFQLEAIRGIIAPVCDTPRTGVFVSGRLFVPNNFSGLIFAAMFRRPIPEAIPVGCTVLTEPGCYKLPMPVDGRYFVFSVGVPWSASTRSLLTLDEALRGRSGKLNVFNSGFVGDPDIALSPSDVIHPPILAALPLLIARRLFGINEPLPQGCEDAWDP